MEKDFNIEELFFGFYATEITSRETIFSIMKDVLIRMQFSIHQCRGQSYDGAANMSGFVNGLRKRVQEIEKRAVYVHCRAHKLNLAVQDAMSSSKEIRDVMALILDLIAFIRGSPKRLAWFAHFQNDDTGAERKSLRPFCPTRWTMRLVSLQAITSNYSAILHWLQEVDEIEKNSAGVKAGGYLKSLTKFDTFFLLEVLRMVFTIIEEGSASLQGTQLNFSKAEKVISAIRQSISDARTDARFSILWQTIVASAHLNESIDEPRLPRQRKVPRTLDDNARSAVIPQTAKDEHRQLYFSLLDSVLVGLTDRFEPDETAIHFRKIESFILGREIKPDYISQHYVDDLDCVRLQLHRDMLLDRARSQDRELDDFESVVDYLKEEKAFSSIIREIKKLLTIVLTSPVSSCTAERSFSGLRRLKTYLRSRMSQERLNAGALMHVHKDVVEKIQIDELLDDFILRSTVRKNTFILSKNH